MNIGTMLRAEIKRVATRIAREEVAVLRKAVAGHRHEIAKLKRKNLELERALRSLGRSETRKDGKTAQGDHESGSRVRFSPAWLKALRKRFGISAEDFGKLIGMSGQSIYNLEQGKYPAKKDVAVRIASLRGLSKKQVAETLAAAGG